ncbi:hypothetical protein PIB30_072114 [Stylosanthes scabra]|uniref:Ubiquitin-like protease family profile domain-containing protein n=1 Tax=Stylosanthes scabra TaxID=79078 RepID=A0ABU6SPN4_9FABA|nr:hypothetical protein [Stylosanthes scabra]
MVNDSGKSIKQSKGGKPKKDVVPKELSDEDHAVFKFFQGKTQAQLGRLIMDTPVDMVENKRLFMRAFLLFVQKTFLLATSSANVTPRAYPTFYDIENTKQRNWALHVHNFLLEELKKAKENKTKSIHDCCYALLIIYFHETQFGKNSREPIAQPPWIDYWNGRTLWDRMKQEKRDAAKKIQILRIPGQWSWCKENQGPTPIQLKKKGEAKEGTSRMMQPEHNLETPIQQPEPEPQQQPPQDDVIDLSSCSDDEQPPHHMDVVHPLVPKVEKLQEDQPPPVLEQPSQSVVEVVPIYPTQEVIDVSSSSEDERPPLIPKTEQLDPYSPSAKIISEELISMNRDEAPSLDLGIDPPLPQREEAPSFDLGIDPPLLTTQDLSDIEELDELVITIMCHILNKQQNEWFEKFVYCVPPEIMVRMFEKHGQSWMDTKNNRPHAIASLVNHEEYMVYLDKKKLLTHRFIFAPILFSEHWWLYVMDIEKREFFVLDSKNIVFPSDERSSLNRFALVVKQIGDTTLTNGEK